MSTKPEPFPVQVPSHFQAGYQTQIPIPGYYSQDPITVREAYGMRGPFREVYQFVEIPAGLMDTLSRDDIKLLMPETLNRNILTLAENKRVGRNLVDVIRINSDGQSWLKEWGFEAGEISELGEIPTAKLRHDKITLTTLMSGISCRLSNAAIEDAQWDILRRHINQAALAMVKFEDAHIMSVLTKGVPDGSTITGTREADHKFQADGGSTTDLLWDDLIKCLTSIQRENLEPSVMVLHPYQYAQFLQAKQFRDTSSGNYWAIFPERAERQMATGEVGSILGLTMFVTNNQAAGQLLVLDPANYAVLAERRPLRTEQADDIIHQAHQVVLTQRFGTAILNNDGAAMIYDLATGMP